MSNTDLREAAWSLIKDLDRSLVGSRDIAVIHATNTSVKRLRILLEKLDRETPPPQTNVPCPCTTLEQDEDCPIGMPSLLCSACDGKGIAPIDKVVALAAEMMKVAEQVNELEDPFAAWESIDLVKTERDHFHNQWRACWAPLTPRNENEKQGVERVLAILKAKLSDGGGIVGPSEVQRPHNDFYRGRRVAFEECATMLRAALASEGRE